MSYRYYAVQRGFLPGVYYTWREAKSQVQNYRGAVHKGFEHLDDAEAFAGAPLALDTAETPIVVVHEGKFVTRHPLTDDLRAAFELAGIHLPKR